jgi:hypothetical protein
MEEDFTAATHLGEGSELNTTLSHEGVEDCPSEWVFTALTALGGLTGPARIQGTKVR